MVVLVVVVAVAVVVAVGARVASAREQHGCADADDEQARREVDPRVEPVGDDPLRERERHAAECEHPEGVRRGGDQPQKCRVRGRPARADEVRRDDRLPVAGGERVRRAPEDGERKRREHDERAQVTAADQRREARVRDPVRRGERAAREQGRRGVASRRQRGRDVRDVERAAQQVLRVCTQLVGGRAGLRADDDLLPSDAVGIVVVHDDNVDVLVDAWPGEDRLEARRVQAGRAARVRERGADHAEARRMSVDANAESPDANSHLLQRRDLGHVHHVADVEAVARDLDTREAVDREVAEGVSLGRGRDEHVQHRDEQQQALRHFESLLRVGAQMSEKCGLRASARRAHGRGSRPRHRSIIARWNSFAVSRVPSRSASFE